MDYPISEENTEYFVVLKRTGGSITGITSNHIGVFGHDSDAAELMSIAHEILKVSNSTVYLLRNDIELDIEDILPLVKDLSLFVFAISEDFVKEKNFARNYLFEYASQNRAYILPIKTRSSGRVSSEFSKVCGKLHVLNRGTSTYETDLKNFFDNVFEPYRLIDLSSEYQVLMDNLFRCRAFISYRKKDIAYLDRLLGFIRSIPELRDMAVFYDSALIPGENYNQRLENEIVRSDVVIFVVTPNLMEDGNYVIREEYPLAVSEGKIIIPVVMADTDTDRLIEVFPEFYPVYTLKDLKELKERLIEVRSQFGEIASLSAEHKHFLAMAYETGKETERNYVLSNQLLEEASEEGYIASIARNVNQHLDGLFADRYDGETEDLLMRAVDLLDSELSFPSDDIRVVVNAKSLVRFSDELYKILWAKDEYLHEEIYNTIIRLRKATNILHSQGVVQFKYDAMFYVRLAGLYLMEGNYEYAESFLNKAEEELKELVELSAHNVYVMEQVAIAHQYKADFLVKCIIRGDLNKKEDLLEAQRVIEWSTICFLKLIEYKVASFPHMLIKDECCIARIMQKMHFDDDLMRVFNFMNTYIYGSGLSDIPYNEDYLDYYFEYNDLLELNLDYESIDELKVKLDKYTDWYKIDAPNGYKELFEYTDMIPDGILGPVWDNFYVSSYKCCICNNRLYKTTFTEGNDPKLKLGGYSSYFIEPARVFVCPFCGRFFATPKGRKMNQGPVFQASPVLNKENKTGKVIFDGWLTYFNSIGDLNAKRGE